jgi:hypothetical protein
MCRPSSFTSTPWLSTLTDGSLGNAQLRNRRDQD